MACADEFQEWTVDLVLDSNPTTLDSRLVFCIQFLADHSISGQVFDVNGSLLSDVSGRNQPFGHVGGVGAGASLMSLDFSMGSVTLAMSGLKLGQRFEMRFRAFECDSVVSKERYSQPETAVAFTPGDGDTGTGTGTQT
jgi:hypothetical protein